MQRNRCVKCDKREREMRGIGCDADARDQVCEVRHKGEGCKKIVAYSLTQK